MLELRPFQKNALAALESPNHVLCIAPTGSGKSLIYERMAARPGAKTLLISPLIALARQQERKLLEQGVSVMMESGVPSPKPRIVGAGTWIASPETFLHKSRSHILNRWRPDLLVVDECHCLWDWGDGFRPAFGVLPELIHRFNIPKSLWLTATLPRPARMDLRSRLPEPFTELGEFKLPAGLRLQTVKVPWIHRTEALFRWLEGQSEAGIIFTATRAQTERLRNLLTAAGRDAITYHAGMGNEERRIAERKIAERAPMIVIATSAFGMGMDHPHFKWVVLWQAPPSLLFLAQSIGRVTRTPDARAHALVFWDEEDFRLLEWTIQGSRRRADELAETHRLISSYKDTSRALEDYFNQL